MNMKNGNKKNGVLALAATLLAAMPAPLAAQSTQQDAVKKKQVRVFGGPVRGHKAGVSCVSYRPDGKVIATSGSAGKLKLWAANSGKLQREIQAHEGDVHLVSFYQDGTRLVSVGTDRTAAFFDAATGDELGRIGDLPEKVAGRMQYLCWQLTADGAYLLLEDPTRKATGILRIDLGKQAMAEPLPLPGKPIKRFALANDGRHLALVERGERFGQDLHLYDLAAKKTIARVAELPYTDKLFFSQDGTKLFAMGAERWQVWNGTTGELITDYEGLVGQARGVALSKDGNRLFAGSSAQGTVVGADLAKKEVILEYAGFTHQVLGVALSPDEKTLVAGSSDGTLRFFSTSSGNEKLRSKGHGTAVTALALSADGSRMISGSHDREAILWDAKRKRVLAQHAEHGQPIICAGFNKLGQAFTVDAALELRLHDKAKGKVVKTVDLAKLAPNAMGVVASGDGATLVISDWEGSEENPTGRQVVCDAATGKVLATHTTKIPQNVLSLSMDGKHAAVLNGDHLAIWKPGNQEAEAAFEPQEWGYYGMALVAPDAAVTGSLDGELMLWKKGQKTPAKKVALSADGAVARSIAVSSDGKRIFVAIDSGVVVYDSHLNEQARITAFDGAPATLALSRDQKHLLCGMGDSTVLVWTLAKVLK